MKNLTKYYCLCFFFGVSFLLFSEENPKVTQFKKKLSIEKNDSIKIELLIKWDEQIYRSDSELDKKLNQEIITICLKKEHRKKKFFQVEYAFSLNNLSLIAIDKSDMYLALDYLLKAYKIAKKYKVKDLESNILNNIGMVYRNIDSDEKALDYYLRSTKVINDSSKEANTYNNIGLCYSDMGDTVNAIKYYKLSLRISEQNKNYLNKANTLSNLADIYFNQKKYQLAKSNYELAHHIFDSIDNERGYSYASNKIGICYLNLKDYQHAIQYSKSAYDVSFKYQFLSVLKESSLNLYKCYKRLNRKDEIIYYMEEYNKYFIDDQKESTNRKILKKQFELEYEQQKIRDDLKFEKKIEIAKEKEKKQKLISYFVILILIFVTVFFFFLYSRYKLTKKQKFIIEQQKFEVESQKHLVEEKNKEILDSITYAKRIQSAILPQPKLVKEYFKDTFILYKPKDIVAGDFYWFEVIDDTIFFAAADCTGHGVPGAMVSVVCHNALNRSVKEYGLKKPGEILDKTREIVIAEFEKSDEDVKDGMDISLAALRFRTENQNGEDSSHSFSALTLSWSGAHNPLWILRDKKIIEYKADKQPIGKFSDEKPFTTHEISIQSGDELYIFTDGFQDQFGGPESFRGGKKFKLAQLRELLLTIQEYSMEEKAQKINEAFENWKGNLDQVDDVCLMGIKI